MWEKLLSWVKFLWNSGLKLDSTATQTEENSEKIERLSELMRLSLVQQEYRDQLHAQEIAALKEKFSDEIEKLELRLRLEIERNRQSPRADERSERKELL